MTLSGKVWPVHVKPQDDELLSSWMIRLAHANGIKVMTLNTLLFGYQRPIWNRDIDRLAPPDVLQKLSEVTGTTYELAFNTTLREYEGKVFEKLNPTGRTKWILPLGIYHRSRKDFGLQYCPLCLKEDKSPYYRRKWRLGFITTCTKHNVLLRDRCQACDAPITPHRVDMKSRTAYPTDRNIVECASCGISLTATSSVELADDRLLKYQSEWELAITEGCISWAGNPSMYTFLFLDGLRVLCSGLLSRKDRDRLTGEIGRLGEVASSWSGKSVEHGTIKNRYDLLVESVKLLDKWPSEFLKIARGNRLRCSTFLGDARDIPYWFESVLRRELLHIDSPISDEQVCAIVNDIEFRYGRYSNRLAKKVYGVNLIERTRYYINPPVSDEIYEMFLASIDHEIAGTQDRVNRLELLRNKVMFAVGRVFGLSIPKLADITIDDLRKRVSKRVEAEFYSAPTTHPQGLAWCEWYILNVKAVLRPKINDKRLFVSMYTHSALKETEIWYSFHRTVNRACLSREVRGYRSFIAQ